MKLDRAMLDKAVHLSLSAYFGTICCADLTEDSYFLLRTDDPTLTPYRPDGHPASISETFAVFADGPLCHPDDRSRFHTYADLPLITRIMTENGMEPLRFTYLRKQQAGDDHYHRYMTLILPMMNQDGHLTAYVFDRRMTERRSLSVEDEIQRLPEALPRSGRQTLLVIEDNDISRDLIIDMLDDDYNIVSAKNGQEGYDLLMRMNRQISLILLDVEMPAMDGYGFLRKKGRIPDLTDVPVIVTIAKDAP